jgi:hypothetical protein
VSYTKVQNDILERADLTPAEKLILIYLYGRKRKDGRPWEVNREQIWTALGIGQDTVKSAISSLKAKGWITDNRTAAQGPDGRWRRTKATVVESRRREVVAPDVSAGRTEGGIPTSVIPLVMKDGPMKDRPNVRPAVAVKTPAGIVDAYAPERGRSA